MKKRIVCFLLAACLLVGILPAYTAAAEEVMIASQKLVDKMKAREGFSATPYWDHSHYSIGYGTTCPDNMVSHYKANPMSREEAEVEFKKHLGNYEKAVRDFAAKYKLTLLQHQFDALVSFSYNCGSAWMDSTSGYFNTAVRQGDIGRELLYGMALYSTASGDYILIGRRLWEANMYIHGDYGKGEKGSYPDNYRWVFLDGNGGKVRYEICAFDTNYKSFARAAFEDIPTGVDKNGKPFVYTFAGWYNTAGKRVTALDSSIVRGQVLYARWTDPEGKFRPDETLPKFPMTATVNSDCNIRKGHGTNYVTNGSLEKGQTVTVLQEAYGTEVNGVTIWCKIAENKWVTKAYLDYRYPGQTNNTPASGFPKQAKVVNVNKSVNVRSGPGTGYDNVGSLEKGAVISVLEEVQGQSISGNTTWCKFGEGKYVSKYYLSYLGTSLQLLREPSYTSFVQPIVEPDWEGSVLVATREDGTRKAFTATRSMVTGFDGTKPGKQTVKATYEGKSVSFDVNVLELKAPTGLKAEAVQGRTDAVKLSWQKAAGASGYYLYYRKAGVGAFIYAGYTTALHHTLSGLEENTAYEFQVRSYRVVDGTGWKGPGSNVVALATESKIAVPGNLQVVRNGPRGCTITWTAARGATHYEVLFKTKDETTYSSAGKNQALNFSFKQLIPNTAYDFKVVGYVFENGQWVAGPQTQPVSLSALDAPGNLKVVRNGPRGCTITWTAVPGATHYEVLFKTKNETTYSSAGKNQALNFTFKQLIPNTAYDFKVVGYVLQGGKWVAGAQTQPVSLPVIAAPGNLKVVRNGPRGCTITWTAAQGATHYELLFKTKDETTYSSAGKNQALNFTFKQLIANTAYDFIVVSHALQNGSWSTGAQTQPVSLGALDAPGNFKVVRNGPRGCTLSWTAVPGATHYEVLFKTKDQKTYSSAGKNQALNFSFKQLIANTAYDFKVVGYVLQGGKWVAGDQTQPVSLGALDAPGNLKVVRNGPRGCTITWTAAQGATHYELLFKTKNETTYSSAGKNQALNFTFKQLVANTAYDFKVVGYVFQGGKWVAGDQTQPVSLPVIAAPGNLKVVRNGPRGCTITWTAAQGATHYEVLFKTKSQTTYSSAGKIQELNFTFKQLIKNTAYDFIIVSHALQGGSWSTGAQTQPISLSK